MRFVWRALIVLAAAIALLIAGALSYRAWRQNETARGLAIHTANGIEEASFVPIGGLEQWIQIRGEDRKNPVILILHGGPGGSLMPLPALFRGWEKRFTVVQWDQRGSGKTYGRHGESGQGELTLDRMTRDGIEVATYLRRRLHKEKVILLGHSWGTILGVLMIKVRPDLFSAFVGTGFVVAKEEKEEIIYKALMEKMRAAGDREGIRALEEIGAPPYASQEELLVEREWSLRYDIKPERNLECNLMPVVLFAPAYSLIDIMDFLAAPKFTARAMYEEIENYDARLLGRHFDVPIFIFNGDADTVTPTDLAQAYFDSIDAPAKDFVVLRNGGHSALLTQPDEFLQVLMRHLSPPGEPAHK